MDPLNIHDDDALLAALAEALTSSDLPQRELLTEGARAAYAFRDLDAALALLVYDSYVDADLVGSVRSPVQGRVVAFECEDFSLEAEILGEKIVGQVVPSLDVSVTVQGADAIGRTATADELGCFQLRAPSVRPFRFLVITPQGTTSTEWLS